MKRVFILLLIVLAWTMRAEDAAQPTLFVAPLEGDLAQIQGWQPALGQGLAEMLITELGKLNKFQMLESTALEHLKEEIKLGDDGFVGKDENTAEDLTLKKGANVLRFTVLNGGNPMAAAARFLDKDGNVLKGITFAVVPPEKPAAK